MPTLIERLRGIITPKPAPFASAIPDVPPEAQVYRVRVSEKVSVEGREDRWHFIFSGPRWPVGIVYIGTSPSCGPAVVQALNLAYYCGTLRGAREEKTRTLHGRDSRLGRRDGAA